MKFKRFVQMLFLVSIVCSTQHVAFGQEDYKAPRFGVKLGYVTPSYKGSTMVVPGAFGGSVKDDLKGGFAFGFEGYFMSNPKSEIVGGLQYGIMKETFTVAVDTDGNSVVDTSDSTSMNGVWLHIPVTYKFKFAQSENGVGGAYVGAGLSYLSIRGTGDPQPLFGGAMVVVPISRSAFGYHLKAGYDIGGKAGVDVEYSIGQNGGFKLGGLGIFGVYKF